MITSSSITEYIQQFKTKLLLIFLKSFFSHIFVWSADRSELTKDYTL